MNRISFIDFLRGISVIPMIIFNYSITFSYFNIFTFLPNNNFYWFWFPRIIALLFIFSAGLSAIASFKRKSENFEKRYLKRGLKLLFIAILITIATRLFVGKYYIYFGIIHFFSLTSFLITYSIKLGYLNLLFSIISVLIGSFLSKFETSSKILSVIGISPNFFTFDYFPIFPWIGVLFFGIFFGEVFYEKIKKIEIDVKPILFIGKNSLLIYLLHQPLLVLILMLLK